MYWFDIVWTVVLLSVVALGAGAIAQIIHHSGLSSLGRVGWILLIVMVPFLGVAAWFALKPARVRATNS